jgi:hypothetical protein
MDDYYGPEEETDMSMARYYGYDSDSSDYY